MSVLSDVEVRSLLREYHERTRFLSFPEHDDPAAVALKAAHTTIVPILGAVLREYVDQAGSEHRSVDGIPVWLVIDLIGAALMLEPPEREEVAPGFVGRHLQTEIDWVLKHFDEFMNVSPICPLCFPNTTHIADLANGYYLVETKGVYGIMSEQCHAGNMIFEWPFVPAVEPEDEESSENDAWFDPIHAWDFITLPLEQSHHFVSACIAAGYNVDSDGSIKFWLTNWAGGKLSQVD